MLKAIYSIGKQILGDNPDLQSFIEHISQPVEEERKGKKQHVVKWKIDTGAKKIYPEAEEVNAGGEDSGKKWIWVGNPQGTSRKLYLTSNLPENIFIAIGNHLEDQTGVFKHLTLEDIYHRKDFTSKTGHVSSFYFLKTAWFGELSDEIRELENQLLQAVDKKGFERKIKAYYKKLSSYILEQKGLKSNMIALHSVMEDGEIVVHRPEYLELVYYDKIGKIFDENGGYKDYLNPAGYCFICGNGPVKTTSSFSSLGFKFYITDKWGFSAGLDGKFHRNFSICQKCYEPLMVSENFIQHHLKTRMGYLDLYVIPSFVLQLSELDLESLANNVVKYTRVVTDFHRLEEELEDIREFEAPGNSYVINFLFYQKNKNEFKILRLIKDVPPTRLSLIRRTEEELRQLISRRYAGNFNYLMDLNRMWYILPIKSDKSEGVTYYLDLINAIFSDFPLSYDSLIEKSMEALRMAHFGTPKFSVSGANPLTLAMRWNFLLRFLERLHLINPEKHIYMKEHTVYDMLPDDIVEFWSDIPVYKDDARRALFLMGYLMGEVARKQTSKGIKNAPVLEKINFQGMPKEKIMRLSSEILEKLRQFKLLKYDEDIYSASKILLDAALPNWSLSNYENVFYLLSGYAFSDFLMYKKAKEKWEENLQELNEMLQLLKNEGTDVSKWEKELEKAIKEAEAEKYGSAVKMLKKIMNELPEMNLF